ncbi:putative integral membrane protein [Cryptosporidium felis]|nr:putative integral membrane protein [Cryptosporidium felis]
MELTRDKVREIINKLLQAENFDELRSASIQVFGEKATLTLSYFCPIYGGLMLTILFRKMIRTTLLFAGTSSIIYILMSYKYSKKKVDEELLSPLKEGLLNSNVKKSIFEYKKDKFDCEEFKKKSRAFFERNKNQISLFGFGMMLGFVIF